MRRLLSVILSLVIAGASFAETPTVNLPHELREANWVDPITQDGSCVFATQVMAFRWMVEDENAQHFRETYSGGMWADSSWNPDSNLAMIFDHEGIAYAYSLDGDPSFLTWSLSTRRPCGVTTHAGSHMQLLVHFDDEWAALIDPNNPSEINWVPRQRFLNEWHNSNSWAVTIIGSPAPPLPNEERNRIMAKDGRLIERNQ